MPRKSSIQTLPADLREAVDAAIREGRATIEDIVAMVRAAGGKVSKSAVGRYSKRAHEQMERYREAQEIARVWVGKIQEDPDGDIGRLLSQMLKTIAFQVSADMGDEDAGATPRDVMFLANALKSLGSYDKLRTEEILRIRKDVAAEAAEAAAAVAKQGGLSEQSVAEIRAAILGIQAREAA